MLLSLNSEVSQASMPNSHLLLLQLQLQQQQQNYEVQVRGGESWNRGDLAEGGCVVALRYCWSHRLEHGGESEKVRDDDQLHRYPMSSWMYDADDANPNCETTRERLV